jgi:hypothetical protein
MLRPTVRTGNYRVLQDGRNVSFAELVPTIGQPWNGWRDEEECPAGPVEWVAGQNACEIGPRPSRGGCRA